MSKLELFERETSTYRDGWAGLDSWAHIGTAKLLQQRMTREPEGYDDGGEVMRELRKIENEAYPSLNITPKEYKRLKGLVA